MLRRQKCNKTINGTATYLEPMFAVCSRNMLAFRGFNLVTKWLTSAIWDQFVHGVQRLQGPNDGMFVLRTLTVLTSPFNLTLKQKAHQFSNTIMSKCHHSFKQNDRCFNVIIFRMRTQMQCSVYTIYLHVET